MRIWRITGNSNMAIQTRSTYISHNMTDITAIPTANLGFSTTPSVKKLTQGDCDNDWQPEIAIWTIWTVCSPISQFLAVGRCRNHLANLLSSSTASKIPNLAWKHRRCHSSRDVIISGFGVISTFPVVGHCCTYLPTLSYTSAWPYTPDLSLDVNCAFHSLGGIISISCFGRHFRFSLIIGIT